MKETRPEAVSIRKTVLRELIMIWGRSIFSHIQISYNCDKMVAKVRYNLGTQRKGNVNNWKLLPSYS